MAVRARITESRAVAHFERVVLHAYNTVLVLTLFLIGCGQPIASPTPKATVPEPNAGIPNPASVYCEEQGNTVEIRADENGGQYGVCIFPDGSECDEWAFYRGECGAGTNPAGALGVSELLENPVYDTQVTIVGQVSLLGELFCPCFELSSGGETVLVWYGLMVEDDGTRRPIVSVEGIQNGSRAVVTGELKTAGVHRSLNDFWASKIEKAD